MLVCVCGRLPRSSRQECGTIEEESGQRERERARARTLFSSSPLSLHPPSLSGACHRASLLCIYPIPSTHTAPLQTHEKHKTHTQAQHKHSTSASSLVLQAGQDAKLAEPGRRVGRAPGLAAAPAVARVAHGGAGRRRAGRGRSRLLGRTRRRGMLARGRRWRLLLVRALAGEVGGGHGGRGGRSSRGGRGAFPSLAGGRGGAAATVAALAVAITTTATTAAAAATPAGAAARGRVATSATALLGRDAGPNAATARPGAAHHDGGSAAAGAGATTTTAAAAASGGRDARGRRDRHAAGRGGRLGLGCGRQGAPGRAIAGRAAASATPTAPALAPGPGGPALALRPLLLLLLRGRGLLLGRRQGNHLSHGRRRRRRRRKRKRGLERRRRRLQVRGRRGRRGRGWRLLLRRWRRLRRRRRDGPRPGGRRLGHVLLLMLLMRRRRRPAVLGGRCGRLWRRQHRRARRGGVGVLARARVDPARQGGRDGRLLRPRPAALRPGGQQLELLQLMGGRSQAALQGRQLGLVPGVEGLVKGRGAGEVREVEKGRAPPPPLFLRSPSLSLPCLFLLRRSGPAG